MEKFGIGQPVRRFEDRRLLTGKGNYIDDSDLPNQAHAVLLRSPHAHAEIRNIDLEEALAAPGVLAIYTGADVAADGLGTMKTEVERRRPDGSPMFAPAHPGLVTDRVRYVGDPVALVVAETLAQAKDAAELVDVDYDELTAVTSTSAAADPTSAAVWPDCPDNISNVFDTGDRAAAAAAFAGAAHVVRRAYSISRIYAQFMEPRGVIGDYDVATNRYILRADVQYPHRVRNALAEHIFRIPENRIHVIAGDVGGGFGTKGWQYAEHRLIPWAARKLGRPIKWRCERQEAIQADEHARDNLTEAELALDAEGRFLAIRANTYANVGAYVSSDRNLLSTYMNVSTLTGVYDIPAAHVHVTCVLSNMNSTAPYRGAGRPEAIYVMERLIEDAAAECGFDPLELRRKNMVQREAMPFRNAFGLTYDCGDFPANMEMVLEMADHAGFEARRAEAAARGKLRGFGLANAIEKAAGPGLEYAEIRFDPGGGATVLMGSKNQGQGHETVFRQILCDRLGLDPADVAYIDGDTERVAFGVGTNGSRSTVIGGSALLAAADKVIEKGKRIAAHLLEAAEGDLEFDDGRFMVAGTDRGIELKEVARTAFQIGKLPPDLEGGLFESATFRPAAPCYPNGAHACEVEVDPDTGEVDLLSYCVVDDVGTVINPVGLKGQIHGGIVQGLGQVLMEQVVYDPDSGQLLTGSFMDYAMPRADDLCGFEVASNPVPTAQNPLGAKGAGEAGTVGALPAAMNAIMDALKPLGVRDLDMPATPERVWRAIQAAAADQN